jgi:hypothetical protein
VDRLINIRLDTCYSKKKLKHLLIQNRESNSLSRGVYMYVKTDQVITTRSCVWIDTTISDDCIMSVMDI